MLLSDPTQLKKSSEAQSKLVNMCLSTRREKVKLVEVFVFFGEGGNILSAVPLTYQWFQIILISNAVFRSLSD